MVSSWKQRHEKKKMGVIGGQWVTAASAHVLFCRTTTCLMSQTATHSQVHQIVAKCSYIWALKSDVSKYGPSKSLLNCIYLFDLPSEGNYFSITLMKVFNHFWGCFKKKHKYTFCYVSFFWANFPLTAGLTLYSAFIFLFTIYTVINFLTIGYCIFGQLLLVTHFFSIFLIVFCHFLNHYIWLYFDCLFG